MCYCYYSKKVHLSNIKCAAGLMLIASSVRMRAARTHRGFFAQSIAENTLDISSIHIQVDHNPHSVFALSSLCRFPGPSKGRGFRKLSEVRDLQIFLTLCCLCRVLCRLVICGSVGQICRASSKPRSVLTVYK